MRATENERRDWAVLAFILLFGFFWILLAGRWALRFTPRWELDTNVQSALDPNSDFLTNKPSGFIEPVDPAVLTNPAWMNAFLTPGASFSTATQPHTTANAPATTFTPGTLVTTGTTFPTTTAFTTSTALSLASPTNTTNTLVYFPPLPTSTSRPRPVSTSTGIATFTSTPISTFTATPTSSTRTSTPTSTSTNTPTDTPTSTTPSFCTTTIIITSTSGSYAKPGGSTCFEYTDAFANGGIFQITSTGVDGMVNGSSCPGKSISSGSTINYGEAQSDGLMMFRITGTAGTVDISVSDWTTYPICP